MQARLFLGCVRSLVFPVILAVPGLALAGITDVTVTDVGASAASVLVVADTPVLSASVGVFSNAAATNEITLQVDPVITGGQQGSNGSGIVRFDLANLAPSTPYYIRITLQESTGQVTWPEDGGAFELRTAEVVRRVSAQGNLDLNELVRFRPYRPSALGTGAEVLVTLTVDGQGIPLAEYTGANDGPAYFDLSNLVDTNGSNLSLAQGQVISVRERYGLACGAADRNTIVRFRHSPPRTLPGAALAPRDLPKCFASDTDCDGTVNVLDVQFLLNSWDRTLGQCGFNPDLDLVADDAIDVLDLQSLLNQFGRTGPFP